MAIKHVVTRGFGFDPVGFVVTAGFGAFSGERPPTGILTRLSLDGYGAKRAGSFAGKEPSVAVALLRSPIMRLHTGGMLH